MSTLLPTIAAQHIISSVSEYLSTSIALAEPLVANAFEEFLQDEGLFKGPYVRSQMPFASLDTTDLMEWLPKGFAPYTHQARAFQLLASARNEAQFGMQADWKPTTPQPALIGTGTGSGKTEAFLYPIIDHCRRNKDKRGVKAIILYPMNALATDQAGRLAKLIHNDPRLRDTVSAGIITGEYHTGNVGVTSDSIITDRYAIIDSPPDIVLTNYKMLDQMLMDTRYTQFWNEARESIQYVVLDEAHTYDGAQGTDVAMLLRRLGLRIGRMDNDPVTGRVRPLGTITPVATSATIGSEEDQELLLEFLDQIFGVRFAPQNIVGEDRVDVVTFASSVSEKAFLTDFQNTFPWNRYVHRIRTMCEQIDEALNDKTDEAPEIEEVLDREFVSFLLEVEPQNQRFVSSYPERTPEHSEILELANRSQWILRLLALTGHHISIDDLALKYFDLSTTEDEIQAKFVTYFIAWLSARRAAMAKAGAIGRRFPSFDVHLWIRELSRIDRRFTSDATFSWSDDGERETDEAEHWLPAIYCRRCRRSGWMTAIDPATDSPIWDPFKIRAASVNEEKRPDLRALIYAPDELHAYHTGEVDEDRPGSAPRFSWLDSADNRFRRSGDVVLEKDENTVKIEAGSLIPVLTILDKEDAAQAARDQVCPACKQEDSIRFVGAAVTTLLSVAVINLFGMKEVGHAEKKALIFTDSVQDAAHRAGYIEARAHAFSLRTQISKSLGGRELSLPNLVDEMVRGADNEHARFDILPPDLARARWASDFVKGRVNTEGLDLIEIMTKRLLLDVSFELGRRSELGRSLMLTGVVEAEVSIDFADALEIGRAVIEKNDHIAYLLSDDSLAPIDDATIVRWVRGVVEHMRTRGGIDHPWLEGMRRADGNLYQVNKVQPAGVELPKISPQVAPRFPRKGKPIKAEGERLSKWLAGTEAFGTTKDWYSLWTSKIIAVPKDVSASITSDLAEALVSHGVLSKAPTDSGATTYAIKPENLVVRHPHESLALKCSSCQSIFALGSQSREALTDGPCLNTGCNGTLREERIEDNYYRSMYSQNAPKGIIAREHTSLLSNSARLDLERAFKGEVASPGAVNTLVATPTLEMGIDIGDLSVVFLSSMPESVSSYVQRVGRAGRLTGNALNVAVVRGSGSQLPKIHEPLSIIDGKVIPPSVYLNAVEILRRQAFAAVCDALADAGVWRSYLNGSKGNLNLKAVEIIGDKQLESLLSSHRLLMDTAVNAFLDSFGSLISDEAKESVKDFDYVAALRNCASDWQRQKIETNRRLTNVKNVIDGLKNQVSFGDDDNRLALRSAEGSKRLLSRARKEFDQARWVQVLERYGLLPNYTLLDDAVDLQVSAQHRKETGATTIEYQTHSYSRGASSALTELAPGSHFYAEGMDILIDAVDLGYQGDNLEHWRVCPDCAYATNDDLQLKGKECPSCRSRGFGGEESVYEVVKLTQVSAEIRAEQNIIDASSEDRIRKNFTQHMSVAWRAESAHDIWSVPESEFAVLGVDSLELRWMNLGSGKGKEVQLGGIRKNAPLFTLCEVCGKQDSLTTSNKSSDHRGWCKHRTSHLEHNVQVALGRKLETQGAILYLPRDLINLWRSNAVPSLEAALRLGFRKVFGGNPSNLLVSSAMVGVPAASRAQEPLNAIVLSDSIPGGTGYLTAFSEPEKMWELLTTAYEIVANCECAEEGRLCCSRCLLPYTSPHNRQNTSRAAAAQAIRMLLMSSRDAQDTDIPLPAFDKSRIANELILRETRETWLEARIREDIIKGFEEAGWTHQERHQDTCLSHHFWKEGVNRRWTLTLQEPIKGGHALPDLVLRSDDTHHQRPFAIFCDSVEFHASKNHSIMGEDARKRMATHDAGYIPWAITHADHLNFEKRDVPHLAKVLKRADDATFEKVLSAVKLSREEWHTLVGNPISLLVEIATKDDLEWENLVKRLQLAFLGNAFGGGSRDTTNGVTNASIPVPGESVEMKFSNVTQDANRSFVAEHVETILSGTPESGESFRRSWETWLKLNNLFFLRDSDSARMTYDQTAVEASPAASVVEDKAADIICQISGPVGISQGVEEQLISAGSISSSSSVAADSSVLADDFAAQSALAEESADEDYAFAAASDINELSAITEGMSAEHVAFWTQRLEDCYDDAETELVKILASIEGIPEPLPAGEEIEGIPMSFMWDSEKVAIIVSPMQPVDDIEKEGWTVIVNDSPNHLEQGVEEAVRSLFAKA